MAKTTNQQTSVKPGQVFERRGLGLGYQPKPADKPISAGYQPNPAPSNVIVAPPPPKNGNGKK